MAISLPTIQGSMANSLGTRTRIDASARIDPKLVLISQLLQLSQTGLEQVIEAELAENPALEWLQDEPEPVDPEPVARQLLQEHGGLRSEDYESRRSSHDSDDETDWTELTPDAPSLHDHLIAQLLPTVAPSLRTLAHYVVDSLNARGYLDEPDEEIALAANASIEDVQIVVSKLQQCEPAGIGARNLQECLLLQLRDAERLEEKLARAILRSRIDDFVARRTMRLARRYGVLPDVIEAAFAQITELTPYPAEGFSVVRFHRPPRPATASPDIVVTRSDSGFLVEVRGPDPSDLTISRSYRERQEQLKRAGQDHRDEKRHVQHYVQRAVDFVSGVAQRRMTLCAIGEYLVREQAGFMNTGSFQYLRPLTRSQMASDLGLHESTVSRATSEKFVQIPTGSIVAFDVFFKPALRVQKMIEEILSRENPDNPLSDDRIAEMLAQQGVHVARRTVNKYRDRTKLLSSRKRRSA
jgi:RNA polymerase sigma-54 factor